MSESGAPLNFFGIERERSAALKMKERSILITQLFGEIGLFLKGKCDYTGVLAFLWTVYFLVKSGKKSRNIFGKSGSGAPLYFFENERERSAARFFW